MERLTIGKVARLAGVGVETIRFYERKGLIERPERKRGPFGCQGYREYPVETVNRLRFIRRAKALGFSLREIKELLELRVAPGTTCADVRRRAQAKVAEIDEKIEQLKRIREALNRLSQECELLGREGSCPILDFLDKEDDDG